MLILGPYQYIHVLDQNSNVTRLEEGPQVFVRRDHEKVVQEKRKHIIIPPRHYCVIENPVLRNEVRSLVRLHKCKEMGLLSHVNSLGKHRYNKR